MYGLSRVTARLWASASASWNWVVNLSSRMEESSDCEGFEAAVAAHFKSHAAP